MCGESTSRASFVILRFTREVLKVGMGHIKVLKALCARHFTKAMALKCIQMVFKMDSCSFGAF